MGRFLVSLGIVIDITAIGFFVMTLLGVGNVGSFSTLFLEPFVCNAGETMWTDGEDGFVCTNPAYENRDVTSEATPVLIGIFVGAMVFGGVLLNLGLMAIRRENEQQNTMLAGGKATMPQNIDMQALEVNFDELKRMQSNIPPEAQALVQQVFSHLGNTLNIGDSASLSERLQQLDEARQQGLITQTEYERVRQAILDSMDD